MVERGPTVEGVVVLGPHLPSFSGATLHVRLEDVTMEDGRAAIVAQHDVPQISHGPDACDVVRFSLGPIDPFDERKAYAVRAHISMKASEPVPAIARGDAISKERYPVLTHGNPDWVVIQVQEVT